MLACRKSPYAGDTNYLGSTSSTISLTSNTQSTVLTLTANPAGSTPGQSVTLTATLNPYTINGVLNTTGETVTFKNGATTLGTGTLSSLGVATLTLTTIPSGTNSLTAIYPGDTNFITSTGSLQFTVGTANTTTLAVSPSSSVTAGTIVTLTASVLAGATPVTLGTVNFCNATKSTCTGLGLVGTAQLTSAGTAVLKFVPGIGSHTYKAVSAGITGTSDPSSSSAQPLTVTAAGKISSTTAITTVGTAGNYTLNGVVTGAGSLSPTGSVTFLDMTNGSFVLGSAALGAAMQTQSLAFSASYNTALLPGFVAIGDLNGDGKMDIVALARSSNAGCVFLGNGDGTFGGCKSFFTGSTPYAVAIGDFTGNGIPDLAVANFGSTGVAGVSILIGNGDGTFTAGTSLTTGSAPRYVAVGDFNGDGRLDLAVANSGGTTVRSSLETGTAPSRRRAPRQQG